MLRLFCLLVLSSAALAPASAEAEWIYQPVRR